MTLEEKYWKDGYAQGQQDLMASGEIVKRGFADNLAKDIEVLTKENAELKGENAVLTEELKKYETDYTNALAQIEKMKPFLDCEHCKNCDDEIVCPFSGQTICEMCKNKDHWELAK